MSSPKKKQDKQFQFEMLEPRVLYSAELLGGLLLDDSRADEIYPETEYESLQELTTTPSSDGQPVETNTGIELVIVDGSDQELRELYDVLVRKQEHNDSFIFVLLDDHGGIADRLHALTATIAEHEDLDAIHLVTHGSDGELFLGAEKLGLDELSRHQALISGWQDSLGQEADILLYGCNVAEGNVGEQFASRLAELTKADVAASENLTGTNGVDADWIMEFQVGAIEAESIAADVIADDWSGVLDITTGLLHHFTLDGTPTDSVAFINLNLLNSASLTTDGYIGSGLLLDELATPVSYALTDPTQLNGTSDFTISMWVKPSALSNAGYLIGNYSGGVGYYATLDALGQVTFEGSDGTNSFSIGSSASLPIGSWSMVTLQRDVAANAWYIHISDTAGSTLSSSASGAALGSVNHNAAFYVGAENPASHDFDGVIDEIRIYDRLLSSADIAQLVSFTANTSPSIGSATLPALQEDVLDLAGQTVGGLFAAGYSDPDGDPMAGVAVIGDSNAAGIGDWEYSVDGGVSWLTLQGNSLSSALMLDTSALLRFVQAHNYTGPAAGLPVYGVDSSYAGAFTDTTVVKQDLTTNGGATPFSDTGAFVNVQVNSTNDAPYFGTLAFTQTDPAGSGLVAPGDLAFGDFDGDGNTDLVVTSATANEVWLLLNTTGDGTYPVKTLLDSPTSPDNPSVFDLNQDGFLDIVAVSNSSVTTDSDVLLYLGNGAGGFTTSGIIDSGFNAYDVERIDANGDTLPDLVVSFNTGAVKIFEQTGPSTFVDTTVATVGSPRNLSVADINGDGDEDVVIAAPGNNQVRYYESGLVQGTGFTLAYQMTSPVPFDVETADLDGDGDQDIISRDWTTGELVWLQNDGAATPSFVAHLMDGASNNLRDLQDIDVDSDGDIDVVVGDSTNGRVDIYRNDGSGEFVKVPVYDSPGSIRSVDYADIDGDGVAELLVTDTSANAVAVMETPNNSALVRYTTPNDVNLPIPDVSASDPDIGGQTLTVQLSVTNGLIETSAGNGSTTFTVGSPAFSSQKTFSGPLSDINTILASMVFDGNTGFVGLAELTITLDDGGSTGSGGAKTSTEVIGIDVTPGVLNNAPSITGSSLPTLQEDVLDLSGQSIGSLFAGNYSDPDGDPMAGIAVVGDANTTGVGEWQYSVTGGVSWKPLVSNIQNNALMLSSSTLIRFLQANDYTGPATSLPVHAVDSTYTGGFTGVLQARQDLTINGGNTPYSDTGAFISVTVTGINDAPHFLSLPQVEYDTAGVAPQRPSDLATGDFNGDGNIDLVVISRNLNEVTVLWNDQGDGTYTTLSLIDTPAQPESVIVADIDGDGTSEILVTSFHSVTGAADILIYSADGMGGFTTTAIFDPRNGAFAIELIDANGDALPDLVVGFNTSDSLIVFEQTAPLVFGNSYSIGTPDGPYNISVADINGDGDEDVVVAAFQDNLVYYYESGLVQGAGFSLAYQTASDSVFSVGTADLDNDGDEDIIWGNWADDLLVWMENDGAATPSFTHRVVDGGFSTLWNLTVADADGDGDVDLITGDNATGEVFLFENDGLANFSKIPVRDAPGYTGIKSVNYADVDGDGVDDMLITNYGSDVIEIVETPADPVYVREVVNEDGFVALNGIAVADDDAGSLPVDVDIVVTNGEVEFVNGTSGLAFTAGGATYDSLKSFTGSIADINAAIAGMNFQPTADFNGLAEVEISINDNGQAGVGGALSASEVIGIDVLPVNDAPVKTGFFSVSITEDNPTPPTITGSFLLTVAFNENDAGGSLDGIALSTDHTSGQGTWQYSVDAGANWASVGVVSPNTALLLDASAEIRFLPAANYNGSIPGIDVFAIDDTYGGAYTSATGPVYINTTSSGGTTPISAIPVTVGLTIQPANDAPTIVDATLAPITEDANGPGATVAALFNAGFSDVDTGDTLGGVAITVSPNTSGNGFWQYSFDGINWVQVDPVSSTLALALDANTLLRFNPAANYNGPSSQLQMHGLDSNHTLYSTPGNRVSIDASVNGGTTSISDLAATLDTTILPVNDAPVIPNVSLGTTPEDTISPTEAVIANLFSGNVTDPDAGSSFLGLAIVGNTATSDGQWEYRRTASPVGPWTPIGSVSPTNALMLESSERLRFVPSLDWNGTPLSLQVKAIDNTYVGAFTTHTTNHYADVSNNGDGTPFSSNTTLIGVTVSPVNDPPTAVTDTATVLEGGSVAGDVSVNDYDVDSALAGYTLLSGPANGTVSVNAQGQFTYNHDSSNTLTDSFTYRVSDVQGAFSTGTVNISVTPVNDPPTVSLANPVLQLPEDQSTASSVKVADIVITDDGIGSNNLTLAGAHGPFFQIVGSELHLAAGVSLDYETLAMMTVTVQVDDASWTATSPDDTATLNLQITDVNEPPTVVLSNVVNQVPEDQSTASSVRIADIVVADDAIGVNNLSLAGFHQSFFQIVGNNELHLAAGVVLDHETFPNLTVTVQVDDTAITATSPDDTDTHSLLITDINEAPTVTLANTVNQISENQSTATSIKIADIVVADDALGTEQLTLAGTHAPYFQIVGMELHLAAGTVLDFETLPNLSVTVQVDDTSITATSPDDIVTYTLQVTDANEPPTITLTNVVSQLPESQSTASSVRIADIVVSDDALGTNNLTLSGFHQSYFQIVGNELHLAAGVSLDFETFPVLSVTVQVDDIAIAATSPDDAITHNLLITDVNEPPQVALTNVATQLPENTSTASSIKIADIVLTDDAIGTNQLSLTGADAAQFQIVGTELHLAAGTQLDFETAPVLNVTVQVDDLAITVTSPDDAASLGGLQILDVNEPPLVSLQNTLTQLPENQNTATSIKVADIVISDDALGTNQLTLAGTHAGSFQIIGTELHLAAGTVLDFQLLPQLNITVQVDDAAISATSPDDTAAMVLQITDVNGPPAVSLTNSLSQLPEDQPTTTSVKVADIVVTDDALGTNQLSLSGIDAAKFQIVGNELHLAAATSLDYEASPTLMVSVEVDDGSINGAAPEDVAPYSLQLTDVNEPPQVSLVNTVVTLPESTNTSLPVKVADIIVADDAMGANALILSGPQVSLFQIIGTSLYLVPGATLDADVLAQLDVVVEVDDVALGTGAESLVSHTIQIQDVNTAPTISLINVLNALPEDTVTAAPIRIADIVVTDDTTGVNNVSISGADAALFEVTGNSLFLVAGAALDYEMASSLDVVLSVDDTQLGTTAEDSVAHQVLITDANEPPSVALINLLTVLPDNTDTSQPVKIADIVVLDDALGTAQLQLSGADASLFQIVGNELYLVVGASLDFDIQPALSVQITVDDPILGSGPEDSDIAQLQVLDTDMTPALISMEASHIDYLENQVPVNLSDTLVVTTPNNGLIDSATVSIVSGFEYGNDWLGIDVGALTTASGAAFTTYVDANSGELTISGTASAADYTQLLRSIEFHNDSEDPVEGARMLEISVTTQGQVSNVVAREIRVDALNDTPQVVSIEPMTLDSESPITLDAASLATIDADHASDQIIYSVMQAAPGIRIQVDGVTTSTFTQEDIDNNRVSFVHDGSDSLGGNLELMVSDQAGESISVSMLVMVDDPGEEPAIGAAAPVNSPGANNIDIDLSFPAQTDSDSFNGSDLSIDALTGAGDSLTQSGAETENVSEQEATGEPGNASTENAVDTSNTAEKTVEEAIELLVALKFPKLPFAIEVFQQSPLVSDMADKLFEPSGDKSEAEKREEAAFANLLDLNPVKVVVDSKEWIEWQVANGGFERSLEILDEQFEEAADAIESQGTVSELVIGTSLGLTTGFLVWLLRGGTLLASLMSIAPMWKQLDPLPILADTGEGTVDVSDDNEVEQMFDDSDSDEHPPKAA